MAFVRARAARGKTYYQLVHGYRDDCTGQVKQRTVGLGDNATLPEAIAAAEAQASRLRQRLERIEERVADSKTAAREAVSLRGQLDWIARKLKFMTSVDTTPG
jgi:small-conductance mechanosensitive channel